MSGTVEYFINFCTILSFHSFLLPTWLLTFTPTPSFIHSAPFSLVRSTQDLSRHYQCFCSRNWDSQS